MVEQLRRTDLDYTLSVPGIVKAEAMIELAFRVSGFVEEFLVREGDPVEAGATIARLDVSDLARTKRASEAALARLRASEAEAHAAFERELQMWEGGSTSKRSLDETRFRNEIAVANRMEVEVALEAATEDLKRGVLTAPVRGIVTERLIDEHEFADARKPVVELALLETVQIEGAVSDADAARLKLGESVLVRSVGTGREFEGTLTRIGAVANPQTRMIPIEVGVANPALDLRAETVGEIVVQTKTLGAPGILVPIEAVLRDASNAPFSYVAVESGGGTVAERRPLKLGRIVGERVAILEGLVEVDRLVVRGQRLLSDGEPIELRNPPESDELSERGEPPDGDPEAQPGVRAG